MAGTPERDSAAAADLAEVWAARADELTAWAQRWVNRSDVWGGYLPLDKRGKRTNANGIETVYHGPLTKPATAQRGKRFLDDKVIRRHFAATLPEQVIGLHTTSPDNTSIWGAVEVDAHSKEESPEVGTRNLQAVLAWYRNLEARGFRPLLTDSNGKGGYHLRALLTQAIPTPRMFWFLRWLIRDHEALGFAKAPECFPKQSSILPTKFGNWLRLPGRHHKRPVWAKVWDGKEWLDGNAAIDHMLSLTGDRPELIPEDIEFEYRISEYMAKMPTGLSEGNDRDTRAYNFLAFMVRDLGRDDGYALDWAGRWDAMNAVQKGPERLREILANVHQYGRNGYSSGLNGRNGHHAKQSSDSAAEQPSEELTVKEDRPHLTDVGNSRRLVKQYGNDLRFPHPWKKWVAWSGHHWNLDQQGIVVGNAKKLTIGLFAWAGDRMRAIQKQLEEMGDDEEG